MFKCFCFITKKFLSEKPPLLLSTLPKKLSTLYNEKNRMLEKTDLRKLCEETFVTVVVNDEQIEYVEEVTRNQRLNSVWHDMRIGRITASSSHNFWRTSLENPAVSYIKSVC